MSLRLILFISLIFVFITTLTVPVDADESGVSSKPQQAEHVLATLGSPVITASPGQRIPLILSLRADDTWHLYWSNPGDSGMPPRIRMDLPDGVSQDGEWILPPPRHLIAGGMGTLVLDHDVILLTYLQISDSIDAEHIAISLRGEWLVCDDHMCLPGNAAMELTIPLGTSSMASSGAWHDRLQTAKERAAQTLEQQPLAHYANDTVVIPIPDAVHAAADRVIFAPSTTRIINLSTPQNMGADNGSAILTLSSAFTQPPETLQGLLVGLDAEGYPMASWELSAPLTAGE